MLPVVLLALLLLSFSAMTWLFPVLAKSLAKKQSPNRSDRNSSPLSDPEPSSPAASVVPASVAILIPVHNEAHRLISTLRSIQRAIEKVGELPINFQIIVGADGCAESSAAAQGVDGVEVIESTGRTGKWQTLCSLIRRAHDAEWLILADCGIYWEADFLKRIIPNFSKPDAMAVAPAYINPSGGHIERLSWWLEQRLKSIEQPLGGPICIHGATICYRRKELLCALEQLQDRSWLNDDVVIPLIMRAQNPDRKIFYRTDIQVLEMPQTGIKGDRMNRRLRITRGNVEWIKDLWLPLWDKSPVTALVAARRVFRVFWGYWALILALSIVALSWTVLGVEAALLVVLAAAATYFLIPGLRSMTRAALASLFAPYLMFKYPERAPAAEALPWS